MRSKKRFSCAVVAKFLREMLRIVSTAESTFGPRRAPPPPARHSEFILRLPICLHRQRQNAFLALRSFSGVGFTRPSDPFCHFFLHEKRHRARLVLRRQKHPEYLSGQIVRNVRHHLVLLLVNMANTRCWPCSDVGMDEVEPSFCDLRSKICFQLLKKLPVRFDRNHSLRLLYEVFRK